MLTLNDTPQISKAEQVVWGPAFETEGKMRDAFVNRVLGFDKDEIVKIVSSVAASFDKVKKALGQIEGIDRNATAENLDHILAKVTALINTHTIQRDKIKASVAKKLGLPVVASTGTPTAAKDKAEQSIKSVL